MSTKKAANLQTKPENVNVKEKDTSSVNENLDNETDALFSADDQAAAQANTSQEAQSEQKVQQKKINPWTRKGLLEIELKDKNYSAYWTTKQKFDKKMDQGWTQVKWDEVANISAVMSVDAKPKGTFVIKREMILVKIHKQLKLDRQKYHASLNRTAKELEDGYRDQYSYGPGIKESRERR